MPGVRTKFQVAFSWPPPVKFQNGGFGAIPLESLEALVGSVMTKSLLAHITPSSWDRISPMLSFRTC